MSTMSLYTFQDAHGQDHGSYSTTSTTEAKEYAQRHRLQVVENVYEWTEAIPVPEWDYTDKGDAA